MAADGSERIRTFGSLGNSEILDSNISLFNVACISYIYIYIYIY